MGIVRLALTRPRTIVVMALLIFLLGGLYILQMPKDIFPAIDVPVVAVIWTYNGLAPVEMDRRVVRLSESAITTSVDNIEHIESQALSGYGIIKVYFQPGTSVSSAITQFRRPRRPSCAECRKESPHQRLSSTTPPTCLSSSWR